MGFNLALAIGLTLLTGWWMRALLAPADPRTRPAAATGMLAAAIGGLGAWGLALGAMRAIPPALGYKALPLLSLEAPLWALALLLWPAAEPVPRGGPARGLRLASCAATLILLLWDMVLRPLGGLPPGTLTRGAALSWFLVLLALA